jgi:aldehyde dehydrogenase (NAD+)
MSSASVIDDARRIFALQQAHRRTVGASTAADRSAKLARLKAAIAAHREDLYAAMWGDFRKSRAEVEITEIAPTILDLDHTRSHLARWMRPKRAKAGLLLAGTTSEVRYRPRGVVLIMAPWNYPAGLVLTPLVAAVAAGNCAVVRPSEKVPRTAGVLARIIGDAFEEREVACLVEPGIELAEALLGFEFDHVFFTGSTRVGRKVMAAAAGHLASVTLELGGKSPLVVDATADVAAAAERAAWGKFVNAGQTCIAPDYALVDERVLPEFVEHVRRAVVRFYGATEDDRKKSPDFPRLIDDAAFWRVAGLLDDAVAGGAQAAMGGRVDPADRYIAPTILTGVEPSSRIMTEEIFGPLLPVVAFRTLDEAIDRINAGPTPLALYVFSRSDDHVARVLGSTASGGATVNDVLVHFGNPELPFGGLRESGIGSYHGWYGFRTFSHEQAVLRRGRLALTKMLYPPYGRRVSALLRVFRRLTS